MSATDVKPQAFIVTDVTPGNQAASTGSPRSPQGPGSGYNGLFRTEDSVVGFASTPGSGGASFDNTGAGLSITDAAQTGLDISTNFTLETWIVGTINATSNKQWAAISKLDSNGGYEVSLRRVSGVARLELIFRKDASTLGTLFSTYANAQYESSVFHHVAFTYSSGTGILYINANPIGTNTSLPTSVGNSSSSFVIGSSSSGTASFNGVICETKLWNTTRTAAQILLDMRKDSSPGDGLVGYWPLGSDTNDYSGNGNHLTGGNASFGDRKPFDKYGKTYRFYCAAGDGNVRYQVTAAPTGTAFTDAITRANGNAANHTDGTTLCRTNLQFFPVSNTIDIYRTFLPFDTSTLTNTVVRGAHVFLKPIQNNSGNVCIVSGTPASTTSLGTADYGQVGTVELATRKGAGGGGQASSFPTDSYDYFELNSSGIANINAGGFSTFALRMNRDFDIDPPTGDDVNGMNIYTSEATAIRQPFLDVVI